MAPTRRLPREELSSEYIDPALKSDIGLAAAALGMKRREFVEAALREKMTPILIKLDPASVRPMLDSVRRERADRADETTP